MATVEKLGFDKGSGGTALTVNPTSQINVGDFIVVMTAERDHALSGVADDSSQAGAANSYFLDSSFQVVDGFVFIHSCRVTRTILTTDTITVTLATGGGVWVVGLFRLDPIVPSSPSDTDAADDGSGGTWSTGATGTLAQADEICMGIYQRYTQVANGTDGGTNPDSPWVEEYFLQESSTDVVMASMVVSATTPVTYSGDSDGSGGNWSGLLVTFRIQPDGASYVGSAGAANGSSFGDSLTFTTTRTIEIGERVVALVRRSPVTVVSITVGSLSLALDSSQSPFEYWSAEATSQIASGATVTVTFDGETSGSNKDCLLDVLAGVDNASPVRTVVATRTDFGTSLFTDVSDSSPEVGDIALALFRPFFEDVTSFGAGLTGATTILTTPQSGYEVLTVAGADDGAANIAVGDDYNAGLIVYRAASEGGGGTDFIIPARRRGR